MFASGPASLQQHSQRPAPTYQSLCDNMLGTGNGSGSWAAACEQATQQTAMRQYASQDQQPSQQQQQCVSYSPPLPGQSAHPPVLNLAKVSRNNESQRTPRRAADATLNHQQHVQNLQAHFGTRSAAAAGSAFTARQHPPDISSGTGGVSLPAHSLGDRQQHRDYQSSHEALPTTRGGVGAGQVQPSLAAQYQQQARYLVPPAEQYPQTARLPQAAAMSVNQEQQQQQELPTSGGFMQRLPHFFGGSGGARGKQPNSARQAPNSARQQVNPYLQALPSATARPHYPGHSSGTTAGLGSGQTLPPLAAPPGSAQSFGAALASARMPQARREVPGMAHPPGTARLAPAADTGGSSGADVFSRLSQGLPSVDTARSARLQATRSFPQHFQQPQHQQVQAEPTQASLPAVQQSMHGPVPSPRTRCTQAAQAKPVPSAHSWQAGMPGAPAKVLALRRDHVPAVDSPGSSTGLTPRAAGLMRPSPASPRYTGRARQPPPQAPLQYGTSQLQAQGHVREPQVQQYINVPCDAGHLCAQPARPSDAAGLHAQPAAQQQPQPQQTYTLFSQGPTAFASSQEFVPRQVQAVQPAQHSQPQLQQAAWPIPQHSDAPELGKVQGYPAALGGMPESYNKPEGSLMFSGPSEAEAIKAVRRESQGVATAPPTFTQYTPAQQQQQVQALQQGPSLHNSFGSLGGASFEQAGQPAGQQQDVGVNWWAASVQPALPKPAYSQSVAQPQQAVGPLLPGLPFIEQLDAEPAAEVALVPAQLPAHLRLPAPGSDLDLIAAVTEEVVEYDLIRQQELQAQQEQAAAVAAAARRVSHYAEFSGAGMLPAGPAGPAPAAPVPTPAAGASPHARAGSSRSSRHPSPLGMSPSSSPDLHCPPLSAARALQQWGHLLSPFEQSEILSFQTIWFVGRPGAAKMKADKSSCEPNNGFDDQRGDYLSVVGDHIAYRYEVVGMLGRGSFGQVLRCVDHACGRPVALKMIRSKRRFQKQAAIEAAILALLREKDPDDSANIVRTYESFTFRNHLCITFELLSINLYEYVKACNFQGSSLTMIRRIGQQVLVTLRFLLRHNIVHCDLKPENILLRERSKTAVKVIDFGSSCYVDQRMYTYIQSRFYRSPEVILGMPYGPPIDIWSLGCILAELLTGQPIFPGEDEREQLACIMEVLGAPPAGLLEQAPRANLFFDTGTWAPLPCPPNSRGKTHRPSTRTMARALGGCHDACFIDFLQRCLAWEPELRMTPDQALQHPWITCA